MSNYETVKELVQGFAKEIDELNHDLGHIQTNCNRLFQQFRDVKKAIDDLNVTTIPEFEVDWEEIVELASALEEEAGTTLQGVESTQQEIESVDDLVSSASSEAEYAVTYADDLKDNVSSLALHLRDIQEKVG